MMRHGTDAVDTYTTQADTHTARVVGLTGGIATGKSTVSAMLVSRGALLIDADQVARAVVAPHTDGLRAVLAHFGDGVRLPSGQLDRRALGRLVFANPAELSALEALLHPRIRREIDAAIAAARARGVAVIVLDAALLIELHLTERCDLIAVVHCGIDGQLERLQARDGFDLATAHARLDAQMDDAARLRVADVVIDNRGTLQELEQQVATLWQQFTPVEDGDGEGEAERADS